MNRFLWLFAFVFAGAASGQTGLASLQAQDLGAPALAGNASDSGGVYTLEAGGSDIWGGADQLHFVYQELTGNGVITARVTGIENTHAKAKGGVMLRETLAGNARNVMTAVHADATAQWQRRTVSGGTTVGTAAPAGAIPRWVRLTRTGDDITSHVSGDGVTWSTVGTTTLANLPASVYVGLAATSHNVAALATVSFDNVAFPTGAAVLGEISAFERIEAEEHSAQSGTGIFSGGTGRKVGSIENGTWLQFSAVDFGPGAARFSASVASNSNGGHVELRLGSVNGRLAGRVSVPGTGGWNNFVDVQTAVAGAVGVHDLFLVFTGGAGPLLDVDYFQFEARESALVFADIGAVAITGNASESDGVYTVEGSGADIGGTGDQFHFVYQPLYGDGEMTARVASVERTTQYAKAAVMIRENLEPGSRHFTTLAHAGGTVRFLRRSIPDGSSMSSGSAYGLPRWLRIARVGNLISSHESTDGSRWNLIGSQTVNDMHAVYVGLAVTSQTNSQLATAVFDQVSFPDSTDTDGDGLPDAWETQYGLDPTDPADADLDADGDGISNLLEYWGLSDPAVSDALSGSVLSVTAISDVAYELNGAQALLRLTRSGGQAAVDVNFSTSGSAGGSDYLLSDGNGNALTGGRVSLPAGAASVDIRVTALSDGRVEYPETLAFNLAPGSGYTLGSAASATATLYDATNSDTNEILFVGYLTPAPGVTSGASGLVQMYLNGHRTAARVSVTRNGLSSAQTNTYIRWGVPDGPGPELRPNLGVGDLTNIVWNIQPIPGVTGQDIVDALHQVGGKYIYVNIGTGNFPQEEIRGAIGRRNGSTDFIPPPVPPAVPALSADALKRDVARFLIQATFGPTQSEIDALADAITTTHGGDRIAGYAAWIDDQLGRDLTRHYDYLRAVELKGLQPHLPLEPNTPEEMANPNFDPFAGLNAANYGRHAGAAWWVAAMYGHDQLRQRYAFALSEIFVIARGMQPLSILPAGPLRYYDMLGSHTTGNFRALLEDVSKHPVMGEYLSHKKNRRATYDAQGNVRTSPDENYAREIMQLFSIGLAELHPDGSLRLDQDGSLIPTYDNRDISELARVFTGWSFGKVMSSADYWTPAENNNFGAGDGLGVANSWFPYGWMYPMKHFPAYHDTGAKRFLDTTNPAGLTGEQDLDAALDHIFAHPNVGPFISRLLIQRFVTSNPSQGYVYRVARKFNDNGNGVRGDMAAVIKAILLDYEARNLDNVAHPTFGKQKEPILRYVHMLRALNGGHSGSIAEALQFMPADQVDNYAAGATGMWFRAEELNPMLGQFPLSAPSVFNWFLPDYAPQGRISDAGLVAPEMNTTSESATFALINLLWQHTHSYGVNDVKLNLNPMAAQFDALKAGGASNTQAVEALFDQMDWSLSAGAFKELYGSAPTPNPRSIIISEVAGMNEPYAINRVRELVYLFVTSPTFVHQR